MQDSSAATSATPPVASPSSSATKSAVSSRSRDTTPNDKQDPSAANPSDDRPPMVDDSSPRARSVSQMQAIATALRSYVTKNGRFPTAWTKNRLGQPLLSWRVELLPYLGHNELYARFQTDEPWDSPANQALLQWIPEVYQSRGAVGMTCIQGAFGTMTAFTGDRAVIPKRVEDGLSDTIVVLEVDADRAVPWTKPADCDATSLEGGGYGSLHNGEFFVIWADGIVGRIDANVPFQQFMAAMTIDRGEAFRASMISASPEDTQVPIAGNTNAMLTPATESAAAKKTEPTARSSSDASVLTRSDIRTASATKQWMDRDDREALKRRRTSTNHAGIRSYEAADRMPVPDDDARRRAMSLVESIYADQFRNAKSANDRRAVVQGMLREAKKMQHGSADEYVLLQVALKAAVRLGNSRLCEGCLDAILSSYDVDAYATSVKVLSELAESSSSDRDGDFLIDRSEELAGEAALRDEYDVAEDMIRIALTGARQYKGSDHVRELDQRRREIREQRGVFNRVKQTLEQATVDGPTAESQEFVGRYYAFYKGQWDQGLPLLCEAASAAIRDAARWDRDNPADPQGQARVGDAWWDLAQNYRGVQASHLRRRARYWYESALLGLDPGLQRTRVEIRIKEVAHDDDTRKNVVLQ
ncbi:MAG: DUF1559 domain-containing protein [Pirellulaceae bacterium]